MPNKPSLELSEVQLKLIEELDILTDAFVSTFNEFGKIIKAYSEEISNVIDQFIKKKTDWRLYDSRCFDLSYRPFKTEDSYEKKFSIDALSQYLVIVGQIVLVKEIKVELRKKEVDGVRVAWGFVYDIKDNPAKYFYVEMAKDKNSDAILSKNEYDKIIKEIKMSIGIEEENFYDLYHPDDKDQEYFLVCLDLKYANKTSIFFQLCKEELIEKFISKII